MKRVAILGKGALALHACEVIRSTEGFTLAKVVANLDEPEWDIRLSDEVESRWPDTELSRSGEWKELLEQEYDLILSVLYDRVIGRSLIEHSRRILNCHMGRLPQYRGMRPINWALKNGESVHGVTIHEVVERVDAGPIVAQIVFPVWPEIDEVRDVWARAMARDLQLVGLIIRCG